MNPEFDFRVVLIQIQNFLTDCNRKELNFLFGDDIPRRLQSDGSVENSLDVLQTLCDRLKISKDNVDYLINGLKAIQRPDCAQLLESKQFDNSFQTAFDRYFRVSKTRVSLSYPT